MSKAIFSFLVIVAVSVPARGKAKPDLLVLKPSSAWHIDYAADSCRITRQFGEAPDQVSVVLNRYSPEESVRMVVSGEPVKLSGSSGVAKVQFGPNEEVQSLNYSNGKSGEFPALVFTDPIRIAPMTPVELALQEKSFKKQKNKVYLAIIPAPISGPRQSAVRYLELNKPLRRAVRLETGSMRAPLSALDKCVDELTTHWGIDVEKHKNLTAHAAPANYPGDWVTTNDYPPDMLQAGQPANVVFRLDIGEDGKPTGCHIQATTRKKEFDDAVCGTILKRARFTPALDAEGKPMISYYINQVIFRLP